MVVSVLLILYGGYFAVRKYNEDVSLFAVGLAALIAGVAMVLSYALLRFLSRRKQNVEPVKPEPEPQEEEPSPQENIEAPSSETPEQVSKEEDPLPVKRVRTPSGTPVRSYGDAYVRQMGYGPVLEISGGRIRDMHNNRYYRLEDNYVYAEGSGLSYEIVGDRIKTLFGNYLFEISGNNINKVFGGYFASVNGNLITTHDQTGRYEVSGSLDSRTLLVIAALLFGEC